ncbi:MAG TPA: glycerate kinase [Solirubrobacterales bacterium]|nr:glycerate kinase [Solirubrobacterales bacterium]
MPARFLVAPDSFKGTYDAAAVAAAIAAGIEAGGALADRCPVADGGEGTMEVLLEALGGEERTLTVHDPLRRPVEASFGLLTGGRTAVVEMARASGLPLVAPEERDAERADTYGTGELIAAALAAGAEKVLVAVGGSATTDGGRGALEALREEGWPDTGAVEVLCDVDTPYEEAARVFGPQKGADPEAVERLTARLDELAAALPRDPRGLPMTGCAGGLSGGLWACGASLRPGASYVLEAIGFDRRLAAADAVIAGEGRVDSQSFEGKIVGILAQRCAAAGKPLHLVVGRNSLEGEGPAAVSSVAEATTPEEMRRVGLRLAQDQVR